MMRNAAGSEKSLNEGAGEGEAVVGVPAGSSDGSVDMIELHRLNGSPFYLNHRHIETLDSNPDTVITLINEHKYIVREKPSMIATKIAAFERRIFEARISKTPRIPKSSKK